LEKLAMKKSLVALAALAVAGVASAQSSVTLFGVVDASISGYSSTSRDLNGATFPGQPVLREQGQRQGSRRELANSAPTTPAVWASVVRKTSVVAWQPASGSKPRSPTTTAKGVSTFARRSTVSLSGGFGEVRLGRDYTPRSGTTPCSIRSAPTALAPT
jgi:predicted porin